MWMQSKFSVYAPALLAVVLSGAGQSAFADLCRDVTVKVKNQFEVDGKRVQIQVKDFDYWDAGEGKWREENFVGNIVVNPSWIKTITTRNLEYVGGESGVVLRVQYQYMTDSNGWSETLSAQSSNFYCPKDGGKEVTVTVSPL